MVKLHLTPLKENFPAMIRTLFLTFLLAAATVSYSFEVHERPLNSRQMEEILQTVVANSDLMELTKEGESVTGKPLYMVHVSHGKTDDPWKVFAVGAQHGNEHSGKDALITIIQELAENPELLPEDIDLYLLPMANPDGVDEDKRRNAHDADLNRDHRTLLQPEVQTIHRIQQRVRAHVTIDCHEYSRDSGSTLEAGIRKWPMVTLGTVNNPYVDRQIRNLAEERLQECRAAMQQKDISFLEYLVGGPPPEFEIRPSTLEADDLRNGLGVYQNLSFIIEAGIYRRNEDPQADFPERVAAYRELLWALILGGDRKTERYAIETARKAPPMNYIPTNYFWGITDENKRLFPYPAFDRDSGEEITIPTMNLMDDIIIKKFVPRPKGYLISGDSLSVYKTLLDRHAIAYKEVSPGDEYWVQRSILTDVEEDFDALYERYDGRQIVELEEVPTRVSSSDAIYVDASGSHGNRVSLLLDPLRLYGLYEFHEFRETVNEDGEIPVYRVVDKP